MKAFVIASLIVIGTAGCSHHPQTPPPDQSTALGEDGTDALAVETASSALTAAFTLGTSAGVVDGGVSVLTPDVLVTNADKAAMNFTSGCMTVTKDPVDHSATYAMSGCTGVWGLVNVSGTLAATYTTTTLPPDGGVSPATPAIEIDLENQGNLLLRNATATKYEAKATFWATSLADRGMQWNGSLSGTTARQRPFTRTASWQMGWKVSGSCITLNGETTGTVENRTITTQVTNYQRCRGECPAAGGSVTLTDTTSDAAPETISISFDGGNVGTFTGPTGQAYRVTLACAL